MSFEAVRSFESVRMSGLAELGVVVCAGGGGSGLGLRG
jgi:hypothetical protein